MFTRGRFIIPLLGALLQAACGGGSMSAVPEGGDPPAARYWVYVGAESADMVHLVRFGPEGIEVERSTHIGRLPTEVEGPHGLQVSPDGRYLFMTTGHGVPDGHFWKFDTTDDRLLAEPILLDRFPATLDLTPDGLYAFVVNFNLHGVMAPSTMSIVYTPDVVEVDRIDLCTMPHGVRTHPSGSHVYTVCMMDDELVEVDTRRFAVSRRFSLRAGGEGPLGGQAHAGAEHTDHGAHAGHEPPTCSPTWAVPGAAGDRLYVACNRSDQILEIGIERWELLRRFDTGRGPYNLDVTADGRLLVATLKQGNGVQFFDLESGETRSETPASTTVVHGVVVSPDDRYAFVSVEGVGAEPGKVDVFDLRTFVRVASVEVGQQAAGITLLRMEAR